MSVSGKRMISSAKESLDLVKRLREAYDKVSCFPENMQDGFMLLLELRNIVPEAADRIEQLDRELRVYMDAAEGHMVERMRQLDELAAEKALADRLADEIKHSGVVASQGLIAYRKARGL